MASKNKAPPERYKRTAKKLSKLSPRMAAISKKKRLTTADKRLITRTENRVRHLVGKPEITTTGYVHNILVPISEKQAKRLNPRAKKLIVGNGIAAVRQRNVARDTRTVVSRNGDLFIRENGRYLKYIPANPANHEEFIETGANLFKQRIGKSEGRKVVWINYLSGRGDRSFTDAQALINYIIGLYDQSISKRYDGFGNFIPAEERMNGFIVYTQPPGIRIKPKKRKTAKRKTPKRKPSSTRKTAKKPTRKRGKIIKAVKRRFKKTPAPKSKKAKLTRLSKPKKYKKAKLSKLARAKRAPRKRVGNRGKTSKNRRH